MDRKRYDRMKHFFYTTGKRVLLHKKTLRLGVLLCCLFFSAGCSGKQEPMSLKDSTLSGSGREDNVIFHVEEEKKQETEDAEEGEKIEEEAIAEEEKEEEKEPETVKEERKKPLPKIVSTASDASSVALAYEFDAGDIVEPEAVEQIGEDAFFTQMMIDEYLFRRMNGKTYKEDSPVPLTDLRYLRMLHCDLDGNVHVGELVCHKSVSDDILTIFHKLYHAGYPIEKMILCDEYENADILLSSADNNTAAFNDRNTVGKTTKSLHAQGIAIDINPLYNPYIMNHDDGSYECAPGNGEPYMDRSGNFPYKIDRNDLCYKLFTEAGFTWGGIWNSPDYMHFFRKPVAAQ